MSKIGYFYIVFQHMPFNNYLRCWIDGSENYEYMLEDDLLDLVSKSSTDRSLKSLVLNAFSTDSLYLWDVENSTVTQLHNIGVEEESIASRLSTPLQKQPQQSEYSFYIPTTF